MQFSLYRQHRTIRIYCSITLTAGNRDNNNEICNVFSIEGKIRQEVQKT